MGSLDLPFEPTPVGPLADSEGSISGGLIVMAATVPVEELGVMPALVFRFATPEGEFYPPMVLVCPDEDMAKLRPLIVGAVQAARRAASLGVSL